MCITYLLFGYCRRLCDSPHPTTGLRYFHSNPDPCWSAVVDVSFASSDIRSRSLSLNSTCELAATSTATMWSSGKLRLKIGLTTAYVERLLSAQPVPLAWRSMLKKPANLLQNA